jgi:hypothetical protein
MNLALGFDDKHAAQSEPHAYPKCRRDKATDKGDRNEHTKSFEDGESRVCPTCAEGRNQKYHRHKDQTHG